MLKRFEPSPQPSSSTRHLWIFGVSRPNESDDVLSIKVPVIKLLNEIEQFTIEFENDSIFNYISLKWDLTKVMIPFK